MSHHGDTRSAGPARSIASRYLGSGTSCRIQRPGDRGWRAYVGFLSDEGEQRVRQAYPAGAWQRLAKIKARNDPTNLLRLNQNIPPAG